MDLDTTAPSSAGRSLRGRGKRCAQGLKRTNFTIYTESAYYASYILWKGFKNTTDRRKLALNKQISSLRIIAEWPFGCIGKTFPWFLLRGSTGCSKPQSQQKGTLLLL
jgi:hypothetical protein